MLNLTGVKITQIDLSLIKEYLKVDYDDEDNLLNIFGVASQSYIETQLGYKISDQWPTESDIPDELTIAAIMIIAHWYDNRQLQTQGTLGAEISFAVSAILNAHKNHLKDYDPSATTTTTPTVY